MALCIYFPDDKRYTSGKLKMIPDGIGFVRDIEDFFSRHTFVVDDVVNDIVSVIDEGELISDYQFIDRVGVTLDVMYLSTSSKALIMLHQYHNFIFNFDEVGDNALRYALTNFRDGGIACQDFGSEAFIDDDAEVMIKIEPNEHLFFRGEDFNYWAS